MQHYVLKGSSYRLAKILTPHELIQVAGHIDMWQVCQVFPLMPQCNICGSSERHSHSKHLVVLGESKKEIEEYERLPCFPTATHWSECIVVQGHIQGYRGGGGPGDPDPPLFNESGKS